MTYPRWIFSHFNKDWAWFTRKCSVGKNRIEYKAIRKKVAERFKLDVLRIRVWIW
jgi:hypothetical protein